MYKNGWLIYKVVENTAWNNEPKARSTMPVTCYMLRQWGLSLLLIPALGSDHNDDNDDQYQAFADGWLCARHRSKNLVCFKSQCCYYLHFTDGDTQVQTGWLIKQKSDCQSSSEPSSDALLWLQAALSSLHDKWLHSHKSCGCMTWTPEVRQPYDRLRGAFTWC